jgi:hypothetical protein
MSDIDWLIVAKRYSDNLCNPDFLTFVVKIDSYYSCVVKLDFLYFEERR